MSQSAAGKSVVVGEGGDAVDFGDSSYNMFVLKSPRERQGDLKIGVEEYGGADGAITVGGHRGPIHDVINCMVLADDSASNPEKDLYEKFQAVTGVLNRASLQWFTFDLDSRFGEQLDTRGEAIQNGPINVKQSGLYALEFQLYLLYPDGIKWSAVKTQTEADVTTLVHTFAVPDSGNLIGNIDTNNVVFKLLNRHSQNITRIKIKNLTNSGTSLQTLAPLASGETAVFTTRTQHIAKLSGGASLMAGVPPSNSFPILLHGVTNTIEITISTGGSPSPYYYDFTLEYRGAFVA